MIVGRREVAVNWEAVGAIAETLGAIGVIVTLVYLSIQIRQNSRLLRASSSAVTTSGSNIVNNLITQDPELMQIWWAGMADRDSLSEVDRRRFDSLNMMGFSHFVQEYEFVQDGVMSARMWQYRAAGLNWMLQQPGTQQWWREWSTIFEPEFQKLVEQMLRETQGVPPDETPRSPAAQSAAADSA
jgi:hypothetical protein